MHGMLGRVKKQLKKSIANLVPDQYFYIILFRGEQLHQSGSGRLMRATAKAKAKAYRFIDDASPGGTTNALIALNRAMQIKDSAGQPPELIYFLTDGLDLQAGNTTQFARQLENLRKKLAPATEINTMGFWTEPGDRKILRTIAKQSGGEFVNIK